MKQKFDYKVMQIERRNDLFQSPASFFRLASSYSDLPHYEGYQELIDDPGFVL